MKEQFLNIFRTSLPERKLKLNKRVSAIAVCFVIAAIFWLLIALSRDYPATLVFPVVYYDIPGQKVIVNELPSEITLSVKTSGFKIIGYHFSESREPVEIDVSARIGASSGLNEEAMVIPTGTFSEDFESQLGNDITITGFAPDSIVFNFSYRYTRRVPVKLMFTSNFEKQYDTTGEKSISPDSVSISGPAAIINAITSIPTERIHYDHLKEPVSATLKLISSKLVALSDSTVHLKMNVEKFTEENLEVPLKAMHVQSGYSLKTFPASVNVSFQVALSRYKEVNPSQFEVIVDAEKAGEDPGNKLAVILLKTPSFVKAVSVEPARVDYLLRKQ